MTDQTARNDDRAQQSEWTNLFGVCAALGEDFGFNSLWLRLAFASALIFAPVVVICTYFALGAVVLVSRIAMPNRKAPPAAVTPLPAPAQPDAVEMKLAA